MAQSDAVDIVAAAIAKRLRVAPGLGPPLVVGVCGAQGSGKSTLSAALVDRFTGAATPAALLSIDDLYRTRADRAELAAAVHPLLLTRGPPGTHDIALGMTVLDRLARGAAAALPRFYKARDDRAPEPAWPRAPGHLRLLILEGWCVGARPQPQAALETPINALERTEDRDGRWRAHVNAALAGEYQALFGRIDLLVLLAAPDFAVVRDWRIEQERALAAVAGEDRSGLMSDAEIGRFVQFHERLTRHILAEMPARADLVLDLGPDRSVCSVRRRSAP